MSSKSNPASRLHELLTKLTTGDGKLRMLDAWATALAVSERIEIEVPRQLICLNDVLDDAERTITFNPVLNHKIYLACFPQIRKVFSPAYLQNPVESVVFPNITPEALARLEFCSEILKQDDAEEEVPPEGLQTIATEVNDLIELVARSSINLALRKALLEALEGVRISISLYRVHGAKGLKKNLQGLFGLIVTEREELKKAATTHANVIERLGSLLERIDSVAAKAMKLHRTLTRPVRYLLGLATSSDELKEEDPAAPPSEVIET